MNAMDSFYKAVAEGNLPVAVPLVSEDGYDIGLGTVTFDPRPAAEAIFHTDPRERGEAAVCAAVTAHQAISMAPELQQKEAHDA